MSQSHRATPVQIPELLMAMGPHLSTLDLCACVQVNRLWHKIFIPFKWHTFSDLIQPWDTIMEHASSDQSRGRKDEDWVKSMFYKYGHHIRDLTSQWPLTIEACCLAPNTTLLTRFFQAYDFCWTRKDREQRHRMAMNASTGIPESILVNPAVGNMAKNVAAYQEMDRDWPKVPVSHFRSLTAWEEQNRPPKLIRIVQATWELILRNPNLTELKFSPTARHHIMRFGTSDLLIRTLSVLKKLTRIDMDLNDQEFKSLPEILPQLEALSIKSAVPFWLFNNLEGISFPCLREFECSVSLGEFQMASLLRAFPRLERVKAIGSSIANTPGWKKSIQLDPALAKVGASYLRELNIIVGHGLPTFIGLENLSDLRLGMMDGISRVIPLLRHFPELSRLTVQSLYDSGVEGIDPLKCSVYPKLTGLAFEQYPTSCEDEIVEGIRVLLPFLPRLEILRLKGPLSGIEAAIVDQGHCARVVYRGVLQNGIKDA